MRYHLTYAKSSVVFLANVKRRCSGRTFQRNFSQQQITQNILQNTKISKNHLTPEISLHLITKECSLFHKPITEESERIFPNDPFWGFYWPGGQALSRYILDHPELVRNKAVLDVGSGCGASSIAAVMRGAQYAIANDIDEVAGFAAHLNASLNQVPPSIIQICVSNLIGAAIKEDIILLGDVFYDEEFADILMPWLQRLKSDGKRIFIGDPGRHGLTTHRLNLLDKLATYELTEDCCIENNGFKFVNVWRFK